MDDEDDFLAAVEADNKSIAEEPKPEPVKVEVEVTEAPEPTPQPEPVEQAAEPEVLELTEPVPGTPKPEPGFVPIAAMLDARDKQKAAEARLAQIEQQRIQQQPVQAPDPYEDPEGFAEFQQAQVGSALYQMNLRYSEKLAKVEHGAEIVEAAKQWGFAKCDTDPHFNAKVATSEDPIGLVVSEYRRDEIASKVNMPEFEQFQACLLYTSPSPRDS